MVVLTHAVAASVGLVLGAIVMRLANSAGRSDLYSDLMYKDILIRKLTRRIALLETPVGPCSAQGGCDCLPDTEEGYAGWV